MSLRICAGVLRESQLARGDVLLLLRVLRLEGHQQGAHTGPEDTDNENHGDEGLRLLERQVGHGVRGGEIAVLRRAGNFRSGAT